MSTRGAVAAGHPLTAEAGARVLHEGGNAVDAAVAAVLTSFVAESPLTGLGAGGFMLVHDPGSDDVLLDFFVEVPGRTTGERRSELVPIPVYFSPEAPQVFNVGAASCGVPGTAAGLAEALRRYGSMPLERLVREPVAARYLGRDVLTNPPPSSGGILIALALSLLERAGSADAATVVAAMEEAQVARTEEFFHGLYEDGYVGDFLSEARIEDAAERVRAGVRPPGPGIGPPGLGSTTHITA